MKNVILILGILTTFMVFGVVAGVSNNAAPDIDMDLTETQCKVCHVVNIKSEHHTSLFFKDNDCSFCHGEVDEKEINDIEYTCGDGGNCHTSLINHHDFSTIFGDNEWDCIDCHEKGVPRPLDK